MFLEYLLHSDAFEAAAPRLRRAAAAYAPSFFAPYVLAGAIHDAGEQGWLVVAPDGESAAKLATDLALYLDRPVPVLPARGVLYGADVAPAPHVVGERQQALAALAAGGVVVAEAVALLERFLPLELQPRPLALTPGAALAFDDAVAGLAALGYERVEQVRGRGEFAVRGGLVDVYPALGDPLRVEFWGDEIDTVRTFSVYSQRTTGTLDEATVWAAFEADTGLAEYQTGLHQAIAAWEREGREEAPDELYKRAGVRALAALAGRFTTAAELVSGEGRRTAVFNPDETYRALADFAGEAETTVEGAGLRERLYVPLADARALLAGALRLDLVQRDQPVQLAASRPQFAARDLAGAERDLSRLVRDDYRVFVVFRHEGEAERATYRLRHLSAEVVTPEQLARGGEAGPGLYFLAAPLREGFVAADLKLAVVSERALLRAAPREQRFVAGTRLTTFFDVRPGDYVVHEDHGIAKFAGIETRTVAGVTRDYLLLQFRGEDRVFVPHDQIGKVSRYVGAGAGAPALDKLGGTHWQTVKTRARKAVVEMAGELLQLYASRQAVPGFGFPPDGELMRQLEDAFPYEETEDQAEVIDEVKNDMEAPHPMDRLVVGDVGYGKTEVALRAAFKAAEAGKQTMVLVPTTILAEQHHMTFAERFADLPVKVGMVSRFRTSAEQRRILAEFSAGKLDVLVGTHRLLSTDVRPKDLGLVVVDEEQRFGVRQKELLRNLKLQVDVVSLSATPIPRTLQMSFSGIRDISVIETPPRGRHEIRTYIGEYRDELVRIAIEKELAREGQTFYLHNRVETIDQAAERVRELAPAARVLVAHGQMHERQLEKVMLSFLAGEADVLVTTSIIESGIDIPSANTLVVERADNLGLAQLYQIRGRIGRSDAHAYAYLLYPQRGAAHERGGGAPHDPQRPHRPGRRLQDRHGGPGDPRRRQPAGRRAVGARRRRGLRDVRADAGGRGARAAGRARRRGGAGARGPAGHGLRAARVHRLRGQQDRRPPAHREGPQPARARRRDGRARRPLRAPARTGAAPAHAPGDQAEGCGAGRHVRGVPRQPPSARGSGARRRLGGARARRRRACRLLQTAQRLLSAHREGAAPPLLGWVETVLDAIIDARVSADESSTLGREHQ